ncbi:MAG TPA: mechanosensitive ion channel domain-containing protein [Gammaproteobacteria bacterium]|nr:mechanosensitive ion channel domain-containing protein [Gammaproteobacteria bacterium]
MNEADSFAAGLALPWRVLLLVAFAGATHLAVLVIKQLAARLSRNARSPQLRKLRTLSTLTTSVVVFTLYFMALGLILREFGVSLTAFFASASVIGLAVGFGSQGLVQDVVTGLTLIFSDLIDVGDLVEISGQTGIVEGITMRFVKLQNALGASVYIPNRTINNVINYPRGYVRCIVDVTLLGDEAQRASMASLATRLMNAFYEQFPRTLIAAPSVEGKRRLDSGKEFLRLRFPIWPNRGGPIETIFAQELTGALKKQDPEYEAWMISVSYEAEVQAETRARLRWLSGMRRE